MFIFKLFVLAFATHQALAQLSFGTNGLQMPPINLFSVYYALRKGFNYLVNSGSSAGPERSKKKESRKTSEIDEEVSYNVTSKSDVDDLVLRQVMAQLNVTCLEDVNSCEGMTMDEMVKKANISLDEDDLIRLIEKRAGVNFGPLEMLPPEVKSPALLPTPELRVAGWYGLYWTLLGILIALYFILQVPYFLTGMTVQEAEAEEDAAIKMREEVEAAALNASSYMTYGENDNMMNFLIAEHVEYLNNNETYTEDDTEGAQGTEASEDGYLNKGNNTDERNSNIKRRNWIKVQKKGLNPRKATVSNIGKSGTIKNNHFTRVESYEEMNELRSRRGVAKEGKTDAWNKVVDSKAKNTEKSDKKAQNSNERKSTKGKEDNKCYEQMLCQRPYFGAKAISVSRFALNILDWIPGFGLVTEALNRRLERFTEAVQDGRQLSCHKYKCR